MGMSVAGLAVLDPVEDSSFEELVVDGVPGLQEAAVAQGMMLVRHQPRPPLER
jgi:hypothetical protein